MGKLYRQVTIEERCEIARLQAEGRSIRQSAADLDRSVSTVARELKRDGSKSGGYQPVYADQRGQAWIPAPGDPCITVISVPEPESRGGYSGLNPMSILPNMVSH